MVVIPHRGVPSMVGDERFERVWSEHAARITRYCVFSTGASDAGEDVAADVLTKFLIHGEGVGDDRIEAWLFTVARNECISHHRTARRRQDLRERTAHDGESLASDPGAHFDGELDPALRSSLLALKERDRLALYLRVVEGRPYAEVAHATGRPEGATRMAVLRSLRRLKEVLAPARATSEFADEEG
jgi:RNA polymerase sigma-70 factor (ECF subfamily)